MVLVDVGALFIVSGTVGVGGMAAVVGDEVGIALATIIGGAALAVERGVAGIAVGVSCIACKRGDAVRAALHAVSKNVPKSIMSKNRGLRKIEPPV